MVLWSTWMASKIAGHNTRECKMSIFISATVFWATQKFKNAMLTVVLVDGVVVDVDGV